MSKTPYIDNLINRLCGIYRTPITDGLGPAGGDEPDNPLEHVRKFSNQPPIQLEAAEALTELKLLVTSVLRGSPPAIDKILRERQEKVWEKRKEEAKALMAETYRPQ